MPGWILTSYYVSEWLIRIGMTPIVVRRRRPEVALAWLAGIYFLPWIGLLFYLLLGQRYLGRRRLRHHSQMRRIITERRQTASDTPEHLREYVAPEQDDLVRLCQKLTDLPLVGGNDVQYMADGATITDAIVRDIDAATHHVHILFYIFRHDVTGGRIMDALIRAARRGVKCRLLADSVGSSTFFRQSAATLREAGVEVREALPSGVLRRKLRRVDLRNHRKLIVIDGRVSYTGSWNVLDPDFAMDEGGVWEDVFMRIAGPATTGLQVVFLEDWAGDGEPAPMTPDLFPRLHPEGEVPIQIVPSGPDDRSEVFRSVTIAAIHEAQSRVILTTPYFVPDETIMAAMRLAVLRGVQVDLVVPKQCNHRICGAAAESYYSDLLESGVHIFRHCSGLLHSKTLSVDTAFALVGSGNIDSRSFFLNFELSVLLYGEQTTLELRKLQEEYIRESDQLRLVDWRKEPAWAMLVRNVAALFGPVL